jgi:isopentenyldiphosphate isomerase
LEVQEGWKNGIMRKVIINRSTYQQVMNDQIEENEMDEINFVELRN